MIRSAASQVLRTSVPSRVVGPSRVFTSSLHSTAFVDQSISDKVRHTLGDLNKKIGQAAATGIDKAQEASHVVEEKSHTAADATKHGLDAVNKKTGQAAAAGIDKAQHLADKAEDKTENLSEQAEDKAQEVKEEAYEKANEGKAKAKEVADQYKQ
ncbi:LADA_0D08768g1_1 [Lachancea dasiensis]|uniref:LADA_0D08768g1_1 n=1 Tax=Lachancea dasiensis TaxID=1072105 RepID=A0A1G4J724_9SACH|nr:LADA_0D08768g1_1 [Lachancea dasiensis]